MTSSSFTSSPTYSISILPAVDANRLGRSDRPGHDLRLVKLESALLRVREDTLVVVDRDPHADAGGLIDLARRTSLHRQLGENLLEERRHPQRTLAGVAQRHFLLHDRDLVLERLRVVRADLRRRIGP